MLRWFARFEPAEKLYVVVTQNLREIKSNRMVLKIIVCEHLMILSSAVQQVFDTKRDIQSILTAIIINFHINANVIGFLDEI